MTKRKPAKKAKPGRKPGRKKAPAKQGGTGLFKPGQSGNPAGRPPGINYREAVEDHAKAEGVDLRLAVWEVTQALIKQAKAGDVQASRLVLDRLCGVQPREPEIQVNVDARTSVVAGPPDGDWHTHIDKMADIASGLKGQRNGKDRST